MTNPRPQAPVGEAPNQDPPVDWRARSRGLENVREAAVAVVNADDWRSGAEWDEALANLAEALASLGLPDEEGEDPMIDATLRRADALLLRFAEMDQFNVDGTYWKDEIAEVRADLRSGYGAAPPPRGTASQGSFVDADSHAPMIAALEYRGVVLCRSCVLPEEQAMTGRFHDWNGVVGSGWTCERCGVELEHQQGRDTAEAFMAGARSARENAVEIAREGLTPQYLANAGFIVTPRPESAAPCSRSEAETIDQDTVPGRVDVSGEGER